MYGYIIFTDIEKYSTLKDADLKIYFNKIVPIISQELKVYKDSAIIWNTWGDAIFAIYDKAEAAINMALAYREAFQKLDFDKFGIRKLTPRIAANFGEFELIFDSVSGKQNVHGTLVNLTARIEPVTTPGEIFVTKEFKDMSISSYDKVDNVRFEDMGEIKLPKNAGILNLYRLCKKAETPMKAAGLLIPSMDYKVQVAMKPVTKDGSEDKPVLKSIEQRLTENSNKKISAGSDEKLNKLVNILKEDKVLPKKETNLIKKLKISLDIQDIFKEIPVFMAIFIYIIAMVVNVILDMILKTNTFSGVMAVIGSWIWLKGYIISSFVVGGTISFKQKKLIGIQNLIITPSLVVFFYIVQHSLTPSTAVSAESFYLGILILWALCFIGFYKGSEYAADKAKSSNYKRK